MPQPQPEQHTFRTLRYAEATNLHRLLIAAGTRPFMFAMSPVMIITLFLALLEMPLNWILEYGLPIAIALATGWTFLQVARTPAVVSFQHGLIKIDSLLNARRHRKETIRNWRYVIDIERKSNLTRITAGHTTYEFLRADWPEFSHLNKQFEHSKAAFDRKASPA